MTLSAFAIQVTTMLALTPEDFATIEPRNGTGPDDYRVGHEKLGLFVFHRWRGVEHRGAFPPNYQQGMLVPARDLISARRLSLRDGRHLRKQFEVWARRAMDLSPRKPRDGGLGDYRIQSGADAAKRDRQEAQRALQGYMQGAVANGVTSRGV